MNNSTNRVEIRNKLLENGYKPLPLVDKGIRIKGWSTADINQEWIDQFARHARYPNTGIRCDNVIAFDIDVTDEALADKAEAIIEDLCGRTELCRVGQWPKRLLLYRLKGEATHSARTGKYEDAGHMVELLASRGRQFAAFGIHPGTGKDYMWEGESPLTTPLEALPVVSYDDALACLQTIERSFEAMGLERIVRGGTRGMGGQAYYDLDDDLEIELNNGTVVTWGGIKDSLGKDGIWGNLRREDGQFGDSNSVHAFVARGNNQPCIHDFARDETHFDAIVSQNLANVLPPQPPTNLFSDPNLPAMQARYMLTFDKIVYDIHNPGNRYTLEGFKAGNMHLLSPTPTQQNPDKKTLTTKLWQESNLTHRAERVEMRPDHPDRKFFTEQGDTVFNLYRAPQHVPGDGELDTLHEFVEHLIPDPHERALFYDWHALKFVHPDWRMHGLVMVTNAYGTGRGTWSGILEKLFGSMYVNSVALHDVMGQNSQAASYNEYMAHSLIVSVPEALEYYADGQSTKYQRRSAAYERLKELCDPNASTMLVKRKYGRNSMERIYASLLISSNHRDALAIPENDRRLLILSNGRTPLAKVNDLQDRIHDWKLRPENIALLAEWLTERANHVKYDPFGIPPLTEAKQAMIDAGQSDLDILWKHYYQHEAKGDVCTMAQWRHFVYQQALSGDFDLPEGKGLDNGCQAIMMQHGRKLSHFQNGIKIKTRKVRPWVIRHYDQWVSNSDSDAIRDELLKNGDPGGAVLPMK